MNDQDREAIKKRVKNSERPEIRFGITWKQIKQYKGLKQKVRIEDFAYYAFQKTLAEYLKEQADELVRKAFGEKQSIDSVKRLPKN